MLVAKTVAPEPILPAQNALAWLGMWFLAAATLAVVVLLVALVVKKVGWHLGYQLGRLKH